MTTVALKNLRERQRSQLVQLNSRELALQATIKSHVAETIEYYDNATWQRLPYRELSGITVGACHLGQLKLALCTIQFLTQCRLRGIVGHVVSVGAADGSHFPAILELFPEFTFDLYDANDYAPVLKHAAEDNGLISPRIRLFRKYFTKATAETYKEPIIFICDARRAETNEAQNAILKQEDHVDQLLWLRTFANVQAAMLKFSLPYTPGKTTYPAGPLCFQAYSPVQSTEMRLHVFPDAGERVYNHNEIEMLLYSRNILRQVLIPTFVAFGRKLTAEEAERLTNYFGELTIDSQLAITIVRHYWQMRGVDVSDPMLFERIMKVFEHIAELIKRTPASVAMKVRGK